MLLLPQEQEEGDEYGRIVLPCDGTTPNKLLLFRIRCESGVFNARKIVKKRSFSRIRLIVIIPTKLNTTN